MFNINDKFYTDICTPYKSERKTDVLLIDRIDYIYNNNDTLCQSNCEFSSYFLGSEYINCTCKISEENIDMNVKIDKFSAKKIYESFYDVLKYSNYAILKCYKLVFQKIVVTKNKGSILLIIFSSIIFLCLLIFITNGINPLKDKAKFIVQNLENKFSNIDSKNKNSIYKIKNNADNPQKKESIFIPKNILKYNKNKDLDIYKSKSNIETNRKRKKNQTNNLKIKYSCGFHNSKIIENDEKSNNPLDKYLPRNSNNTAKENKIKALNEDNKSENQNTELDDYELNDLEYEEATKYDQSLFFQTYFSFIKREHSIIFTFFIYNDYNLTYIKICRFIFLIASDMAMSAFFFSDESMHKLFLSYGKYDFVQEIPQIIYITIFSQLIETFLCYVSLTDKHIYEIISNHRIKLLLFKYIDV